ncbi:MAG: hypothetical protein CSB24_03290 [Deltaproteobacteria bacterium]|nr:MAG: hypothetical protein CSB24_03290 [Deltaproteobacteria bacterium]
MEKAIALGFEGGIIFRNVRPVEVLLDELNSRNIEYVQVDPAKMKYGSWQLVLVFKDGETRKQYLDGQLEYEPVWVPGLRQEKQRINPLKAAKRAAKRGV